jgi:CO dehydrogenase/acetyl-CoA synthase delta subunit
MARVLNQPQPARVRLDPIRRDGMPVAVNDEAVESLRESWLVEDRWWTPEPLRRRYWELVGRRGRNVIVFHDLCSNHWFIQ